MVRIFYVWLRVLNDHIHLCATVPVIAVFTKYDYFKDATEINMEDENPTQEDIDTEVERVFEEQYLRLVKGATKHVRLESELLLFEPFLSLHYIRYGPARPTL